MKKTILFGLTVITLAFASNTARAGDVRFSFHIGLPLPRVCVPAPPPVCVTPPVVYVQPRYYYPAYTHYGYRGHYRPGHGHARHYCHSHKGYCGHKH